MAIASKNLNRWVVLLRGINVSGQKLIKMELLRNYLSEVGFENVKTYIQSGNIVLESKETDAEKLAEKIMTLLKKKFGYEVPTMVRSYDDFTKVIEDNPFKNRVFHEKEKLYVGFLQQLPEDSLIKIMESLNSESETCKVVHKEIYIVYMKDGRKLKFSNNFMERKLKTSITTRNWTTVNKICAL